MHIRFFFQETCADFTKHGQYHPPKHDRSPRRATPLGDGMESLSAAQASAMMGRCLAPPGHHKMPRLLQPAGPAASESTSRARPLVLPGTKHTQRHWVSGSIAFAASARRRPPLVARARAGEGRVPRVHGLAAELARELERARTQRPDHWLGPARHQPHHGRA